MSLARGLLPIDIPNPYELPVADEVDAILMCPEWYKWLTSSIGARAHETLDRLRGVCPVVIGLEGYDALNLAMPPSGLDFVDAHIKAPGLYRDRDLYNYQVGPYYPGSNWTSKRERRRLLYDDSQLAKLRLSVPLFVGVEPRTRARIRALKPGISRVSRIARTLADPMIASLATLGSRRWTGPQRVSFVGSITHTDRARVLMAMKEAGLPGPYGATEVPPLFAGTAAMENATARGSSSGAIALLDECERYTTGPIDGQARESGPAGTFSPGGCEITVSEAERRRIRDELDSNGLLMHPLGRWGYERDLRSHAVAIAPPGFGELTFRHTEAMRAGAVLVCPDLSHAEMMFPLEDRANVMYCRHDWSDLQEVLRTLAAEPELARTVAANGAETWRSWAAECHQRLWDGITRHILDAIGMPASDLDMA